MTHNSTITHTATFTVDPQIIDRYTTLLQSGVRLISTTGTSVGRFLETLPGFDIDYLAERVQTIFFDGSAIDDLDRTFHSPRHTLALSAAMPGLAGAIFRKNSLCGSLRTATGETGAGSSSGNESIIKLKLFNMIAREKGEGLLKHGGNFSGHELIDFFQSHPFLLDRLKDCHIDGVEREPGEVLSHLEPEPLYHLFLRTSDKGLTQ